MQTAVVHKDVKLGFVPEGWMTPTIDRVFEFLKTKPFPRNQLNYDEDSEVFYIHYGDIHATYNEPILDFKKVDSIPRINGDIELPSNIQFLKDGDVVIADASEDYDGIGEAIEVTNLNGNKVIGGLHTFALRDKEGLTAKGFRAYIFKNPKVKKALKVIATGSKVYGISKTNVKKFKIVLPPLPEQQKIAQILSTWDRAIAKQEVLISRKQQLKIGLMQQLLSGKKRFEEFGYKWPEVRLHKLVSIMSGDSPSKYNFIENGIFPYLKVEDLNNCEKYQKLSRYYSNEARNLVPKDSVIFPKRGAAILNNKVRIATCEMHMDSNIMAIAPKGKQISTEFLFYKILDERLERIADTSTIPQINNKHINPYKILLPAIEEQQKIASVLSAADQEITLLKQHLKELQDQKHGLMQQLLTGEIRVRI